LPSNIDWFIVPTLEPIRPAEEGEPVTEERFQRAVACFQRRELASAAALCDEILADQPDHVRALGLAGLLALLDGRPEGAAERLARAAALEPSSYDILSNLGTSYVRLERFAEAVEVYERALALRPTHKPAHINLATAYRAIGQYDKAIAQLEPLLAEGGEDAPLLAEFARLKVLANELDAGIRLYRKAIAVAPALLTARQGLAYTLQLAGRQSEALEEYGKIAAGLPQDARAQADLGLALVKAGAAGQAIGALRRAVALEPKNTTARAALGQLFRDSVPSWHVAMLNDEPRNAAYDAAIRRAVRPGSLVLDIGTGSGLLAMMAARAGAGHVYACESVPVIAEKAREIVAANGLADRITVIPKSSLDLRVGDHLPRKADVLVSEIVDVILLGEGIVRTLAHALAELVAQGAASIPRGGAIHAMLVDSPPLYHCDRASRAAGFDVSAFNEFSRYNYFTTNVRYYGHRPLSRPVEIFRFDFTRPPVRSETRTVELPIAESGTCHALVSWFELVLDDQGRVTSDPASRGSHWMQAVHLWNRPRAVKAGDVVAITASHDADHVYFLVDPD